MTPQPGTAGTDDDPLDAIETEQLVVNGQTINNLVGLAFDSASASDGVLRFDGTGSTSGITDGSAKVIVGGTVYDVAGGEWVDFSGTSHSLDSWEKVINSQFNVSITGTNGPVAPGNTLDVTADVSNAGTDQDTQTVTLDIDNSVGQVDSTSVTLSGGGSVTKTLSWAVPSGQTKQDYTATVSSADDTASQTVTVGSPPPQAKYRWPVDEGSGQTLTDSRQGTAISLNFSTWTTGNQYVGSAAIDLDGSDDEGTTASALPEIGKNQTFSVEIWAEPQGLGTGGTGALVSQIPAGNNRFQVGLDNGGNGNIAGTFYNGSSFVAISSSSITLNGGLKQIVYTYDASTTTGQIYVDTASGSGTQRSNMTGSTADAFFIGNNAGGQQEWNGIIDLIQVHDKELTQSEITSLYNAHPST